MRHLKTYENLFTTRNKERGFAPGVRPTINPHIEDIIKDRLSQITDIMDDQGSKFNVRIEYNAPSLSFSDEWSNECISIDIVKSKGNYFEIEDVKDTILELISQMKDEKYIFCQFNLRRKLNQVMDIDNTEVWAIEDSFRNLTDMKTDELYLSFYKKHIPYKPKK